MKRWIFKTFLTQFAAVPTTILRIPFLVIVNGRPWSSLVVHSSSIHRYCFEGAYQHFITNVDLQRRGCSCNQQISEVLRRFLATSRGGGDVDSVTTTNEDSSTSSSTAFVTLSNPAPGSPFHLAFPVHNLEAARHFYGQILGCQEGRSSSKWQDFSLHGHQIVCHWVGDDYRGADYYNPVDGDEVPVPHFGLALSLDQFHELADRLTRAGVEFIIKPHLRFVNMPGEQYTMFFKDPSGNNLEFKAMTHPENLFAKYNVVD